MNWIKSINCINSNCTKGNSISVLGRLSSNNDPLIYTAISYDDNLIFYAINSTDGELISPGVKKSDTGILASTIVEFNQLVAILFGMNSGHGIALINPINSTALKIYF